MGFFPPRIALCADSSYCSSSSLKARRRRPHPYALVMEMRLIMGFFATLRTSGWSCARREKVRVLAALASTSAAHASLPRSPLPLHVRSPPTLASTASPSRHFGSPPFVGSRVTRFSSSSTSYANPRPERRAGRVNAFVLHLLLASPPRRLRRREREREEKRERERG